MPRQNPEIKAAQQKLDETAKASGNQETAATRAANAAVERVVQSTPWWHR